MIQRGSNMFSSRCSDRSQLTKVFTVAETEFHITLFIDRWMYAGFSWILDDFCAFSCCYFWLSVKIKPHLLKKIEEYSFWVEGQNPPWWGSKFSSTGFFVFVFFFKKESIPKGLTFFFFKGYAFRVMLARGEDQAQSCI